MKKLILSLVILLFTNQVMKSQVKIGEHPTEIINCAQLQINGGKEMIDLDSKNPSIYKDYNTFVFYQNYSDYCDKKKEEGVRVGIGTTMPHCALDVVSENPRGTSIALRNYSRFGDFGGHDWSINSKGTDNPDFAGSLLIWDNSAWDNGASSAGSNRLLIDPYGRVGLGGIYYPKANLELRNSDPSQNNTTIALTNYHRWVLRSESNSTENGAFIISDSSINDNQGAYRFFINADGKVGIGTNTPESTLHVAGGITANDIKGPSDKRFKKNIEPIENALLKVTKLNGYTYEWRRDEFPQKNFKKGKDMGLIAQEVEKIYPEVVYTADDEMKSKSIDYSKLVPALIEAIKELQKEVEELKSQMPYQKR